VTVETILGVGQDAMRMALLLSAPILLFALVAGLIVSVFQALTQINEMTLAYVPKIAATILALALFGPWMLQNFLGYAIGILESLPEAVK
jgi:flagellar biosynthesis protein FliQ